MAVGGLWGSAGGGDASREFPQRDWLLDGITPGNSNQWLAQLAGVACRLGRIRIADDVFVEPASESRFYRQRVSAEGELYGMDLYELGAGAYPDFVIHREDFRPR